MADRQHVSDASPDDGVVATEHEIDVLIIGSGPAGAAAAVMLARYGLRVSLVTRSNWVADSPRAHITNQRTMEVLRAIGLEAACRAVATPAEFMANEILCTSIAGLEIARVWSWGGNPSTQSDYLTASPGKGCDLPQDRFEPILLAEAARLGVRLYFETVFEALEQDMDGVWVTVSDLRGASNRRLRAHYVIGADGGQSAVAEAIGLPFTGQAGIAKAMNVRFTADLSKYVAHRPGSLYAVIQPERVDGLGNAMIRMVRPWNDWIVSFVHLGAKNAHLTREEAEREVRLLIGDDSVDVTVTGFYPWRINHLVADNYSVGRVFCIGDAVHRHPPMNGLGANTCVQDAFNLAWKLAFVLRGQAGPGLLESFSVERQPIGKQIVDRAIKSWHDAGELLDAMGLDPEAPVAERLARFGELFEASDEGEKRRRATRLANDRKAYVYHASGVEMNQIYTPNSAVVTDGAAPFVFTRDSELSIQQTSHPGARLPHAWVATPGLNVSTLDLVSSDGLTLFVRERGEAWAAAATALAAELAVVIQVVTVGLGGDVTDPHGDAARLFEISEAGCLLVRPDQHVAWRSEGPVTEPLAELRRVVRSVLALR